MFRIAEDLEERKPYEVYGTSDSGVPETIASFRTREDADKALETLNGVVNNLVERFLTGQLEAA